MEPTNTRKTLRRAIAKELRMPFFRRYTTGELSTDTGSTSGSVVAAELVQADGFWDGSWLFMLGTEEQCLVRSFKNTTHAFIPEPPLISAPADSGDSFEMHSVWNAEEIHDAINRAIEKAGRVFTDTVEDKTLILKEDVLEYDITGLERDVFILSRVFLENTGSIVRGTATAGTSSTITVESVPTDIDTGWKISIYSGTGAGQLRSYASNVGLVVTPSPAWATTPDTTSKYAMWDANEELYDWVPVHGIYTDNKEYPDFIRLKNRWPGSYGLRLRLGYESLPVALIDDDDTTSVPKEYIKAQAIAFLHEQRRGSPKADAAYHEAQRISYQTAADMYLATNAPVHPQTLIQTYYEATYRPDSLNPLGW